MQKLLRKAKNQKGFTLVELMVVVVIIGILVAIAVPIYNNVQAKAQINAHNANVRTLEAAAAMYLAESNPIGTEWNVSGGGWAPYIVTWPVNPIKNTVDAAIPGSGPYVVTITAPTASAAGTISVVPGRQ